MTKEIFRTLALALLALGLFGASYLVDTGFFGLLPPSVEDRAEVIIHLCEKNPHPASCYDEEIPRLMDYGVSMEEAFLVARLVQEKVGDYYYCHILGHRLASKETAKDPSRWTEVIAQCPTGMCSNGCLHGAAQERFRSDVLETAEIEALIPQLSETCESGSGRNFTGLERASCYHSLGHLAMYISGADVDIATRVCDRVADKGTANYVRTCYEGAYMQIFQPLEPEDFALVMHIPATTTESARTFCDTFTLERRAACQRESWPLYEDVLKEPGGIDSFCSLVPGEELKNHCYRGIIYILTAKYKFNEERIGALCTSVSEDRKASCFADAAARLIETDYRLAGSAVNVCERALRAGGGDACFVQLLHYSTYNFHTGSKEFYSFCNTLPESWGTRCKNGEGARIKVDTQ
jgi:hypothetical protein